jgi:Bromodomain
MNPICLEEIRLRLDSGLYRSREDFLDAFRLLVSNCVEYTPLDNDPKGLVHRAHSLLDWVEHRAYKLSSSLCALCATIAKRRKALKCGDISAYAAVLESRGKAPPPLHYFRAPFSLSSAPPYTLSASTRGPTSRYANTPAQSNNPFARRSSRLCGEEPVFDLDSLDTVLSSASSSSASSAVSPASSSLSSSASSLSCSQVASLSSSTPTPPPLIPTPTPSPTSTRTLPSNTASVAHRGASSDDVVAVDLSAVSSSPVGSSPTRTGNADRVCVGDPGDSCVDDDAVVVDGSAAQDSGPADPELLPDASAVHSDAGKEGLSHREAAEQTAHREERAASSADEQSGEVLLSSDRLHSLMVCF